MAYLQVSKYDIQYVTTRHPLQRPVMMTKGVVAAHWQHEQVSVF
jgi:hypothetical protein